MFIKYLNTLFSEPLDSLEFSSGDILTSPEQIADLYIRQNAACKIVRYDEENKKMYVRNGILSVDGTTCRFYCWWPKDNNEECQLYQQIEIHPDVDQCIESKDKRFAEKGDSGSLVFLVSATGDRVWAIGMVVAGIPSTGSAIVTPIWTILETFNLPLRLESFENQRLRKIEKTIMDLSKTIREQIKPSIEKAQQGILRIDQTLEKQEKRQTSMEENIKNILHLLKSK